MTAAIGAVLVVGGCAGLGLAAFIRLAARVRLLSAFLMLTDRLASEITFRLTPLPELPERIPSLKPFWDAMGYTPYGTETLNEAWTRAASKLDLPDIDRSLIGEIGGVLGQYDAESQERALGVIRKQLDISLAVARENRQKYGRLYGLLGLLGGCLLVVILI